MISITETYNAIQQLTRKRIFDVFCYKEMLDRKNPCVDWLHLPPAAANEFRVTLYNVTTVMPEGSKEFDTIYKYLCGYFGTRSVSRDVLYKVIARTLMCNYQEFITAIGAALAYRARHGIQQPASAIASVPTPASTSVPTNIPTSINLT